jgi:hypothetical protein
VWRDTRRLSGNELFDDTIQEQLERSAVLLPVFSQHYLSSEYCRKEVRTFAARKLEHHDLSVGAKSRIIKIYRRPIDRSALRSFAGDSDELVREIDGSTGFPLFFEDANGQDRDALLAPEKAVDYWQKVEDVARAIKQLIDRSPEPGGARGAVYLARTAADLREQREALRRELEARGYEVLPGGELPEDIEGYRAAVAQALSRSRLSIHLVGARYGAVPDGAKESGVVVQSALARERAGPALRVVLWTPQEVTAERVTDEAQREYLKSLATAAFDPEQIDLVHSSFEQLKAVVMERLEPRVAPAASTAPAGAASVYLIHDPADGEEAKRLRTALRAAGCSVLWPASEGTPEELAEVHRANLLACEGVVALWGKTREAWVRLKLRDVEQAFGWGRTGPYRGRVVCIAPPDSPAKQDFDGDQVVVLRLASLDGDAGQKIRELAVGG